VLYKALEPGGFWPDPAPHALDRLIQVLMDLDQSNAPEAFWRSGSINRVGLGRLDWVLWFLFSFLDFLANCTYISATWTPVYVNFLTKKFLKIAVFLGAFLTVLWYFHILKWIKIYVCQLFLLIWIFLCSLWNFLHDFGVNSTPHDPNVGYMILWWFCSWFPCYCLSV